jgi:hypothetical protein
MVIALQENGIFINYMGLPSVHIQMVTVIGGNIRMITKKDMDQLNGLMERDTRVSSSSLTDVGME